MERGFLSYVVDSRESGVAKAIEIAKVIVSKSPIAVQGTKGQLDYARDHTIREGTYLFRQDIFLTLGLEYAQIWNSVNLQTQVWTRADHH